jgi:uncharacterized protein with GYD domain
MLPAGEAVLFLLQLKVLPGQFEEATRLFKHPKLPNNVMVHEFFALFGKPDAVVIFEAADASTAADFVVQFGRVAETTTSLALPIEELKWTS